MKNLIILIITLTLSFSLSAQIDNSGKKISVQGFLKDANGKAVPDDEYNITFRIYNDIVGGTNLWTGSQAVNVFGGVYTAQIDEGVDSTGNEDIFIGDLEWDLPYYLSVEINNNGVELQPRTALTYSPYAYAVNKAQIAIIAEKVECSGAVGDVKYSILAPDVFAEVNGDCWVPMDGRGIGGTALQARMLSQDNAGTFITKLPDASGLFLRAHEYNESPNNNDPDRTTTSGIAVLQLDANKEHMHAKGSLTASHGGAHSHGIDPAMSFKGEGTPSVNGGDGNGSSITSTQRGGEHSHTITGSTANSGGAESRPKNLNLYVYIRIN